MQHAAKVENVRSDINVTPLVDVVLVLLIIFMVVTPMLQTGPPVKLPQTSNPTKKPEEKSQIVIAVASNKMLYVGKEKQPLSEAQLATRMQEAFERSPDSTVVIKGDARVTYGDVKKTMLEVKKAGFSSVGLITEKKQAGVGG
jgi:TolR protein